MCENERESEKHMLISIHHFFSKSNNFHAISGITRPNMVGFWQLYCDHRTEITATCKSSSLRNGMGKNSLATIFFS